LYLRENFARGDLASKQSLRGVVQTILTEAKPLRVDQILKVSHY